MNKKVKNIIKKSSYDDKEDIDIKNIAYTRNTSQKFILYVLIFAFLLLLSSSVIFIGGYYNYQKKINVNEEIIEISTPKNDVLIVNNGTINETITSTSFKDNNDLIIQKINSIKLYTRENSTEDGIITLNVKYTLTENDFPINEIASNDSEVLVRFSYSYDQIKWTSIKNVISTSSSNLSPLMGNYYDVSGLVTTLSVLTNYELKAQAGKSVTMYWRAETIIKNTGNEYQNNKLSADFKIEYNGNA